MQRKTILSAFSRSGQIQLDGPSMDLLHTYLRSIGDTDPGLCTLVLNQLVSLIKSRLRGPGPVDRSIVQTVLGIMEEQGKEQGGTKEMDGEKEEKKRKDGKKEEGKRKEGKEMEVVDAFSDKNIMYRFHAVRKAFVAHMQGEKMGEAEMKRAVWVRRYEVLKQRTRRNKLFMSTPNAPATFELCSIEQLASSSGKKCALGMLTSIEDAKFALEDPLGHVDVDLSEALLTDGLFVENCFVIAEGEMRDTTFHVETLAFPPPETRQQAVAANPVLDFCTHSDKQRFDTLAAAANAESDMMVVMSDVYLDNRNVVGKINEMFKKFVVYPKVFVFIGDFVSEKNRNNLPVIKSCFDDFAALISTFTEIINASQIVLIPGPTDVCKTAFVLPQPPLLQLLTNKFVERINQERTAPGKCVTLATNPCRIRYYKDEIVIFRQDLMQKMRRNCILPPANHETDKMSEHLVKTLIDQAHLCPLPLSIQPIIWSFDHSLALYPPPAALFIADSVEQFRINYASVETINPGSFPSDFSFVVYYPFTKQVEFSSLADIEIPEEVEPAQPRPNNSRRKNVESKGAEKTIKPKQKVKEKASARLENNRLRATTGDLFSFFKYKDKNAAPESVELSEEKINVLDDPMVLDEKSDLVENVNDNIEAIDEIESQESYTEEEILFPEPAGTFVADEDDLFRYETQMMRVEEEKIAADRVVENHAKEIRMDQGIDLEHLLSGDEESEAEDDFENLGKAMRIK